MILSTYEPSNEIGLQALEQLLDPEVQKHTSLALYLTFCAGGLKDEADQKRFLAIAELENLDPQVKEEILNLKW